jgi:hypothetical protein
VSHFILVHCMACELYLSKDINRVIQTCMLPHYGVVVGKVQAISGREVVEDFI